MTQDFIKVQALALQELTDAIFLYPQKPTSSFCLRFCLGRSGIYRGSGSSVASPPVYILQRVMLRGLGKLTPETVTEGID
jgi:hypothetical protein